MALTKTTIGRLSAAAFAGVRATEAKRMESISNEQNETLKTPSVSLFLALILSVGFAFSLLFTQLQASTDGSDIRIINASNVDFVDVVVGGINYGNVAHGQSTGYQHWKRAYRYSSASFRAAGKVYSLQPIDYVGEKPLGSGKFAYLLKPRENGEAELQVQGDEG
jgi:hypothetical protein